MLPLPSYSFVFSSQQMQIIVMALQDAPYKVAAPVLNHMQAQIDQQERAAVEAANPPQPAMHAAPAAVVVPEPQPEPEANDNANS
jgi:hypothetical protein